MPPLPLFRALHVNSHLVMGFTCIKLSNADRIYTASIANDRYCSSALVRRKPIILVHRFVLAKRLRGLLLVSAAVLHVEALALFLFFTGDEREAKAQAGGLLPKAGNISGVKIMWAESITRKINCTIVLRSAGLNEF